MQVFPTAEPPQPRKHILVLLTKKKATQQTGAWEPKSKTFFFRVKRLFFFKPDSSFFLNFTQSKKKKDQVQEKNRAIGLGSQLCLGFVKDNKEQRRRATPFFLFFVFGIVANEM
jgi:hypothetical protein